MSKRVADKQLTPELAAAMDNASDEEAKEMEKASEQEMKGRKIVKARRRKGSVEAVPVEGEKKVEEEEKKTETPKKAEDEAPKFTPFTLGDKNLAKNPFGVENPFLTSPDKKDDKKEGSGSNPFGSSFVNPFANIANPFASASTSNPFAKAADAPNPFATAGSSNPFASSGSNLFGSSSSENPFGVPSIFSSVSKAVAGETEEGGENPEEYVPKDTTVAPKMDLLSKDELKTGEEDETAVHEVSLCKLYLLQDGAWKDLGRGSLKVNRNNESKRTRLIFRSEGLRKVKLNHFLHKETRVLYDEEQTPRSMTIYLLGKPIPLDDEEKKEEESEKKESNLCVYNIRTQAKETCKALYEAIKAEIEAQ